MFTEFGRGFLLGWGLASAVAVFILLVPVRETTPQQIVVTCGGEDSCSVPVLPKGWTADYHDNAWHLTEGK